VGILRRVVLVLGNDWEPIELVNPEIIETAASSTGGGLP
jgi:hypothetical protein